MFWDCTATQCLGWSAKVDGPVPHGDYQLDDNMTDEPTLGASSGASEDTGATVIRGTESSPNTTKARDSSTIPPAVDATVLRPVAEAPDGQDSFDGTTVRRHELGGSVVAPLSLDANGQLPILRQRFQLIARLGQGGMSQIYKARDLLRVEAGDQEPYLAVKFPGDEFGKDPRAFLSLQQEARKLQRLSHPNIVTVYDFDRDDGHIFMTMEFLDGRPLSRLGDLEKALGKTFDRADLILQIAEGLRYAHEEGVIHSDLKPDNVFVTRQGRVKIIDFDIARHSNQTATQTYDPAVLGALTPRYASAEIIVGGQQPDPRDDIYALGLIACELLTGQHPYQGEHAFDAYQQKKRPLRISGVRWFQRMAITKAIKLVRAQRTETAELFIDEFSGRRARRWRMFLYFVLLLLSVGYAAYEEGLHLALASQEETC